MKFLLGIKQNMSQIFDDAGNVQPVTVIKTGSMKIARMKTKEKDGYEAVQVSLAKKNAKRDPILKEFKGAPGEMKVGDEVLASAFKDGDLVRVSAISKGKGFQGVVKRHGFHGGPRSHGQKHSEREPGSISGGLRTSLRSGMRMAGRMGGDRITVKNLKVVSVNPESGLILISGAVPGRRGTLVEIRG